MTVKPVKVNLPELPRRKSNDIYKWFQHQQGVENLEHRIVMLEAELDACKKSLESRRELLKAVRVDMVGENSIDECSVCGEPGCYEYCEELCASCGYHIDDCQCSVEPEGSDKK